MRVKGNALSFGIRNTKRSIKDPLPYSLQELNTKVWNKWYPKKVRKYKCNGKAMMEIYSPDNMDSKVFELMKLRNVFNAET